MMKIKEFLSIAISILFIALIISVKVELPKIIITAKSFLLSLPIAFIIVFIFVFTQKLVAYSLDCETESKLLSFRQFWFEETRRLDFDFPLWLVLPSLLLLISNGFVRWLSILDFDVEAKKEKTRKKFHALTEDDVGKISLAGPVALLFFGIIFKALSLSGINYFSSLAFNSVLFAFLALLPLGNGFKLLVSSRMIWFFTTAFAFFILLLIRLESLTAIILVSLIFALLVTLAYYLLYEK